eukprot:8134011-Pyramimonas_sp.AAC.1
MVSWPGTNGCERLRCPVCCAGIGAGVPWLSAYARLHRCVRCVRDARRMMIAGAGGAAARAYIVTLLLGSSPTGVTIVYHSDRGTLQVLGPRPPPRRWRHCAPPRVPS